ncbi:uncharacterized protein LOC131258246 isoform X2 [Magnolia sinica]|uniref:uncharacterized protein LOC131258246 isoform X2 n=1 Tax=Magnolia sinica TaxID=86752 RepID=UPI00265920F7|nr:uncharacterized protein LOC131258246 isoform X2 [Magnolia sinica]
MEEVAQDMETRISCAMRARIRDFKDQEDSLTLETVRRSLEKDMGLKKFTLDAHKRFIKQCLHECFCEIDDENVSTYMGKNSEQVVDSVETEGDKSEKILSEDIIKKAIKKRASYFRDNSETITLSGARRLLEEDLKLEKNALDAHKSFISKQLDEVLQSPEVVESMNGDKKKGPKKASDSKVRGGSSKRFRKVSGGHGSSDSSDVSSTGEEGIEEQRVKEKTQAVKKVAARNNEGQKKRKDVSSSCEEGIEEQRVKQKTQAVKKVAARNNEGQKKRKRSTEERKPSRNEKNKRVKLAVEKGSNTDGGGHSSEDGKSKSSAEEPVKKKRETSTQVYGKRVEQLKSIIKACRMSIPPSVYKRAKQAPENKREAHLMKELEEILGKEGLSSNPSEKEIKEVKKQKERAKLGIDVSNIVSSSRRRSTSNFIIPPPQPRLAVEKNDGGGAGDDDGDEEDTDDKESESEGASEDVKKQKKRAKLGIDMSNIVSSSRRRSTSNFIIPPPKPRLAVAKNGGVGGGGGGDDDKEDTNDEESESEGVCEGITLHAGDSSTSAQGSNSRKKVEFNQVGQLVGENAVSFSTFIGRLTRAHCPIRYADWRSVPDSDKDNLWSMVRDTYEIDEKYKEKVLQKVNKSLRNWKWELRRHYDKFDQDAEGRRNCPKGVKQEEWECFIDVESSEQSISRRENGKASRKEMKHPHTTGRRGAARTAEKMLMENPNAIITRTDLYVATHTRSDGSYPTPELSITMERIKSIIASDPASTQRDLDHDPVAQVCGRDSRGLVRGMGEGISKTTIMASTPYMVEARTERNAHMFLESKMETTMVEMIKRLDEEKALRMSMEQQLADIRQQIAFQGQQVHCSPDTNASQAYHQSGDASSLREDSAPTPRTIQICRLLSGRLMRDNIGI